MNNKLPGTIATSQSDFETFTHPKTNMTTMRERFDDTFYEEVNSFMGTSFGDSKLDAKLKEFIEQEIKLKDQGHKAELESIKEEIKLFTPSPREINYHTSYNEGQIDFSEHTISIIDSHINKLSN